MSLEHRVLDALAGGETVSGQALAQRLGVSRTAVWKAVGRLQALGVEVEAAAGAGYRLPAPVDRLDEAGLRAGLSREVGLRLGSLEVLAVTGSTNDRVMAACRASGQFAVCLADYQAAGRGRQGRRWMSPPGAGICLSVGARFHEGPGAFAGLSLAVGVAAVRALEDLGVHEVGLKWPNDLVWAGKKLGGVLIELRGEAEGPSVVAVGLGLNHRLPRGVRELLDDGAGLPPADLAEVCARPPGRTEVAARLVDRLARTLDQFAALGLGPFTRSWQRLDALHGLTVRARGGGRDVAGVARGIDSSGALLVEGADGVLVRVTGGEVSLRAVP